MRVLKKFSYFGLFSLLILTHFKIVRTESTNEKKSYDNGEFVTGRVIVGMKPNSIMTFSDLNQDLFKGIDVVNVEVLSKGMAKTKSTTYVAGQILLLELKQGSKQSVIDAINQLEKHPDVAYAEPDYLVHLD